MNTNWTAHVNPEIVRSLRVTLPPKRFLFIAVFTFVLLLIASGVYWNDATSRTYLSRAHQITRFGDEMYRLLGVVLFALLFVLTPATAALSFIQEKIRGTSIFQQMVLLSPFDLAVGKFVGSGLMGYFLTALIFPFYLASAAIGDVDFSRVARLSLFLLIGGLCCQAVGLFISAALSGPGDRFVRGGLLTGPAVGGLGALVALGLNNYFDGYYATQPWQFYGLRIKAYAAMLGLLAFVGVWAFAGTVRRIKASQLIPLRPWPTWLFFASAEAVLTGLFWGGYTQAYDRHIYENPPVNRLIFYLLLNWVALMILAGSSVLGRGRLREWWSASHDPLAVFQRREIRNALVTFIVALGISLAGLIALWASFHINNATYPQGFSDTAQLLAITVCFTMTVAGMAVFIQYCALQRFRIGAWAGVALTVIFYLIMGAVAASLENKHSTAALLNPLIYANAVTGGNPYVDRRENFGGSLNEPVVQAPEGVLAHGLIAEAVLALSCFGLAYIKWRRTEEEILQEST